MKGATSIRARVSAVAPFLWLAAFGLALFCVVQYGLWAAAHPPPRPIPGFVEGWSVTCGHWRSRRKEREGAVVYRLRCGQYDPVTVYFHGKEQQG